MDAGGDQHLYTKKAARYLVNHTTFFARLLAENKIPTNFTQLIEDARKVSRYKSSIR